MRRLRGIRIDFERAVILRKSVVFRRMFDKKIVAIRYDQLIADYDQPASQIEWYYDLAAKEETVVVFPALVGRPPVFRE